jgi:hypothetical protein
MAAPSELRAEIEPDEAGKLIVMLSIIDVPLIFVFPVPIPEPSRPVAKIVPPRIVKFPKIDGTVSTQPVPIPAPERPVAVTFESRKRRVWTAPPPIPVSPVTS